ncbi:hypothetical protein ACJW31_09G073200 [Castanea mollissima]
MWADIVHVILVTSYTAKMVTEESFTLLTEARIGDLITMNLPWGAFGSNIKSKKILACKDYIRWPFPVSAIWMDIKSPPILPSFQYQNSSTTIALKYFASWHQP